MENKNTTPTWGEELTAEERALIDEYMDLREDEFLSVREAGAGTWEIETPEDTYEFSSAAELLENIRENLREMYEEIAQRADFGEYLDHYYRLTTEDYGEDALVKIHYNREYKTADICLASANEDGEWGAWWATVDADYFTVCDQKRVVDLVLRNSDQGCSVQTSCRSLRELACSERDTDLYDLFQYDVVINPKEVAR